MARFNIGQLVITPGADEALKDANENPATYLKRHMAGDWGDVSDGDAQENEVSVLRGLRILSAYHTSKGVKVWVITEADRASTTLLLPEEY